MGFVFHSSFASWESFFHLAETSARTSCADASGMLFFTALVSALLKRLHAFGRRLDIAGKRARGVLRAGAACARRRRRCVRRLVVVVVHVAFWQFFEIGFLETAPREPRDGSFSSSKKRCAFASTSRRALQVARARTPTCRPATLPSTPRPFTPQSLHRATVDRARWILAAPGRSKASRRPLVSPIRGVPARRHRRAMSTRAPASPRARRRARARPRRTRRARRRRRPRRRRRLRRPRRRPRPPATRTRGRRGPRGPSRRTP